MQKEFLIRSAISDIEQSIKDNASLSELALILYQEKDIEKAYKYINFSMEDALFYNSQLRYILLSNVMPLINESYQVKSNKQKTVLKTTLIFISVLSFFLLLSFIYIFIQNKKLSIARNDLRNANIQLTQLNEQLSVANFNLNDLNNDLSESNLIKEQYIGSFLAICSNYIDKLDGYRKMVKKHITGQKVEELLILTKSRKIIDVELTEFYQNFDNTFLSIYPN
ncbi:MAG: DUF6377 domain-containing protein, partial [Prolixibacteraceae bacterium]|nr:DUF6377 domain-containing protein [Prolixibacteraceae bacterium]